MILWVENNFCFVNVKRHLETEQSEGGKVMKACPRCGSMCEDQAQYCNNCGAVMGQPSDMNAPQMRGNYGGIFVRSIPLAVIFSIITCGIYSLYWMAKVNDEINQLSGDTRATTGGLVVVFSIITCGIYSLYWYYKMGEKVDRLNGAVGGSSAILYIVLGIFGLGIVNMCLMQDAVNRKVQ